MKIGILGGTFDPIHNGHLELAKAAVTSLGLDKLLLMPCYSPPHKTRKDIASAQDRLEMVKLAIKGSSDYEASDFEIKHRAVTFSIDTLKCFKKDHPKDDIFFVIGSDSYRDLTNWKNYSELPKLAKIAVAQRPTHEARSLDKAVLAIDMSSSEISSSEIRHRIRRGEDISGLVPKDVGEYVKKRNLYSKT